MSDKQMPELLGCPFCGKQPEYGTEYTGILLHRFRCIGCEFHKRYVIQAYGDTKEQAAKVWNTRHLCAPSDEIDGLEKILRDWSDFEGSGPVHINGRVLKTLIEAAGRYNQRGKA